MTNIKPIHVSTHSSYIFMIGAKLQSPVPSGSSETKSIYDVPEGAGKYRVAEICEITRFGKLFHQTGRLQAADSYLWISPFVR